MLKTKDLIGQKEVVLIGNPNCGKTSLFNALTGMRQTTANYPGVTVEKKIGKMLLPESKQEIVINDLPGIYSLVPRTLDEKIVHDVLLGAQKGSRIPDLLVLVLDASNLERNLYLATQIIELGLPTLVALNMWDIAVDRKVKIDVTKIESRLGVPCVSTVGIDHRSLQDLKGLIERSFDDPFQSKAAYCINYNAIEMGLEEKVEKIATYIHKIYPNMSEYQLMGEAFRIIGSDVTQNQFLSQYHSDAELDQLISEARSFLTEKKQDWFSLEPEYRYQRIEEVVKATVEKEISRQLTVSEKLDQVLTHPIWGLLCFAGVMAFIFQSIFTWASVPMDLVSLCVDNFASFASGVLPEGKLQSLVVDGMIAGVGNVVIFLPQIFLLFLFIAFLEDIGYMSRAAFVLDRIMKRVGLNGKAFLPLLSSFACAIPGIMATRTIEDRNDRLATILVAPLMSCSARLPVYALMIGAFIPSVTVFGFFDLKGVTLFSMYLLSITAGLTMAFLFRKTFLKGNKAPFVIELPPYRVPHLKNILLTVWDRAKEFLYRAGTIIFAISIVLWFLISHPESQKLEAEFQDEKTKIEQIYGARDPEGRLSALEKEFHSLQLEQSYAGRLGKMIEPVIQPMGFDWKMGIGLVASFAAREVIVSTLAIIYQVGEDADETSLDLIERLQSQKDPVTGEPQYTPLTAVALMVFFVLACQCMSTLAVTKRETNSWYWPSFMFIYMSLLAWGGAFLVFQVGKALGFA